MKKEEVPKEKSFLDKLVTPIIVTLAIGLALLLIIRKNPVTLLTGLTTANIKSTTMDGLIFSGVIVLVILVFYKLKK